MSVRDECICCCEIDKIKEKIQEGESTVSCITKHEEFEAVCLNVWVLQAAYFEYRQCYGESEHKSIHE